MARTHRLFTIRRVAPVGDRRLIATTRIRIEPEPVDIDWISALKATDRCNLSFTITYRWKPSALDPNWT
ncbi:MAG: hypothetical protein OXT72_14675 [Gammaproteobacteria bacterium]|nr:hypothetical protein [Gammaproteobacteria bacterium]MDE0249036.1 hypothetical protein [Gammaproteobacteria bacterium]